MPIDPSISLGYKGMDMPNPLNQMAQVSQIQASQRQGQAAQMQLDEMKNDRMEMAKLQQEMVAKGGSPDLSKLAQAFIQSSSPTHQKMGIELLQKLQAQSQDRELMGLPPQGAAPTAPTAAPMAPTAAPMRNGALGSGTFGMTPEPAPVNALAPAAAAPVAPVNALAPAGADNTAKINQAKAMLLSANPGIRTAGEQQLKMLTSQAPDAALMQQLGYPLTQAGYQSFRDAQRQDRLKTPAEMTQALELARANRAPGANIYLPPQEKAEQGARGTLLVKEYGDISNAAKLAAKTLPSIDTNLNILNNGFKTGFGTETIAAGANVLSALGVPNAEKFATNSQKFLGSATQAVLQKQLEQKGPQTESDAQRIQQTGAQLGNTVQANQFMLSAAKAQLKRDMDQRGFYDSWWKQNKTYDGAESAWYTGEGGKSLFDRPELKAYKEPTAATAATAAGRPSLSSIFTVPRR
jgi:hypothetical protein